MSAATPGSERLMPGRPVDAGAGSIGPGVPGSPGARSRVPSVPHRRSCEPDSPDHFAGSERRIGGHLVRTIRCWGPHLDPASASAWASRCWWNSRSRWRIQTAGSVRSTRSSRSTTTRQPAPSRATRSSAATWRARTAPNCRRSTPRHSRTSRAGGARRHAGDRRSGGWPGSSAAAASTRPCPRTARRPGRPGCAAGRPRGGPPNRGSSASSCGVGERAAGEQPVHRAERRARVAAAGRGPGRCATAWSAGAPRCVHVARHQRPAAAQGDPRRGAPGREDRPAGARPAPSVVTSTPCTQRRRPVDRDDSPAERPGPRRPRAPRSSRGADGGVHAAQQPPDGPFTQHPVQATRRSTPTARAIAGVNGRSSGSSGVQRVQRERFVHARQGDPDRRSRRTAIHRLGRHYRAATHQGTIASSSADRRRRSRSAPARARRAWRSGGAISGTSSSIVERGDRLDLQHVADHRQPDQLRADQLHPDRRGLDAHRPGHRVEDDPVDRARRSACRHGRC